MFLVVASKILVFSFVMIPIAAAAIATGIVFGSFLIGASRNPIEKDMLFSNSMVAFVIIESFVFTALLVSIVVWFAINI